MSNTGKRPYEMDGSCYRVLSEIFQAARKIGYAFVWWLAVTIGFCLFVPVASAQTNAREVSVGDSHACALNTAGGVECWGSNGEGQLGNGTTTDSLTPVAVSGLSSGVAAIAAYWNHTCALTTTGAVECWGDNTYGDLGNGTTTSSSTPVAVSGLSSGVAAIAVGLYHSCALTSTGELKCWGDNQYGELGNGTTTNSLTPVAVAGFTSGGAVAIAAGSYHTCALTSAGGVKCWGNNQYGNLGNGTTTGSQAPIAVSGLSSGVAAITAGGSHACALTSAGGLECWGDNENGQLGNGTTTNSLTPEAVSGLSSGVATVNSGNFQTCAITTAGVVLCWGDGDEGELGDGGMTSSSTPVAVIDLSGSPVAVSAGDYVTCAVTTATTGRVQCWGAGGSLGNGTTTGSSVPVAVNGF